MPPRPRVLVTRTREQGSALAEHLRALGAEPVLIPTIELAPPTSFCALDAALACLRGFDWLLFTSSNAARSLAARARRLGIAIAPPPPTQRIAAIGPSTASALRELGLASHLIPPQATAESLAAALRPHIHIPLDPGNPNSTPDSNPDSRTARMLFIRAEHARNTLPEALTTAGADLTIAAAYRNLVPAASAAELRRLFSDPANLPVAVTFTSSSTAINLITLLDEADLELPPEILRISIGPITSETLRALGHPPHAEAPTAGVAALAETTLATLHHRSR